MSNLEIKKISSFIKYFFLSFVALFIISISILFIVEDRINKVKFNELKSHEAYIVQIQTDYLNSNLNVVFSDLFFLRDAYKQELQNPQNYENIASDWQEFSTQRKQYDQIRFIDVEGNEKIRINYASTGCIVVDDLDLQNKKDRYYFTESILLNQDEFYISPMDLNIEGSLIETPYKPVIRLSMPVYTSNNKLLGIIVLNYKAQHMLDNYQEIAETSLGKMVLLNRNGYWLSSGNSTQEFGFMFPEQEHNTFQNTYPVEWNLFTNDSGQFVTANGLFTYSKYDINHFLSTGYEYLYKTENEETSIRWYIVSMVLRDQENKSHFTDQPFQTLINVIRNNPLYIVLLIILSALISGFVYLNQKSFQMIKYYSEYDGLTNVLNRRAGLAKINKMFSANDQSQPYASFCFIDIDGLKQINDVLGHKSGDDLIITSIQMIKSAIREDDFMIRMGGDEFLIVLKNATEAQAEEVWERIRGIIHEFNQSKQKPYLISVSHGIKLVKNTDKHEIDTLIKLADEKMYEEKRITKENFNVFQ